MERDRLVSFSLLSLGLVCVYSSPHYHPEGSHSPTTDLTLLHFTLLSPPFSSTLLFSLHCIPIFFLPSVSFLGKGLGADARGSGCGGGSRAESERGGSRQPLCHAAPDTHGHRQAGHLQVGESWYSSTPSSSLELFLSVLHFFFQSIFLPMSSL